jgi:ubiquinone biosynthesis protein UbiJ
MLHTLQSLLAPAALERLTLVLNHVLGGEAVATERLRPHAGRSLAVELRGWPTLLPPPPVLRWRVTPAGLLEWEGLAPAGVPDLALGVDAANPAALMLGLVSGQQPAVQIDGDAALAADVNWLMQNLRWDAAADLERLFGPAVAQQLAQLGASLAGGLRSAVQALGQLGERLRPRGL